MPNARRRGVAAARVPAASAGLLATVSADGRTLAPAPRRPDLLDALGALADRSAAARSIPDDAARSAAAPTARARARIVLRATIRPSCSSSRRAARLPARPADRGVDRARAGRRPDDLLTSATLTIAGASTTCARLGVADARADQRPTDRDANLLYLPARCRIRGSRLQTRRRRGDRDPRRTEGPPADVFGHSMRVRARCPPADADANTAPPGCAQTFRRTPNTVLFATSSGGGGRRRRRRAQLRDHRQAAVRLARRSIVAARLEGRSRRAAATRSRPCRCSPSSRCCRARPCSATATIAASGDPRSRLNHRLRQRFLCRCRQRVRGRGRRAAPAATGRLPARRRQTATRADQMRVRRNGVRHPAA